MHYPDVIQTRKFNGQRWALITGALFYILLFHYTYVHLVAPPFSYMGYIYLNPRPLMLILGMSLAVSPTLYMPIPLTRPSQATYWILYIVVYVPCMLVPLYSLPAATGTWTFLLVLTGCFYLLRFIYVLPLANLTRFRLVPSLFWIFIATLSLICYAFIIQRFGLKIRLVALADVYDVRYEYREEIAANGALVAYALNWQAKVLNPLVIGFGFTRRKPLLVMLGFLGQLSLFSITGQKGILFSAMLIAVLIVAYGARGLRFGLSAAWGGAVIVGTSVVVDWWQGSIVFVSLFVRRVLMTSGLLTGFYVDFFSTHAKGLYAWSFLSPFFDYPYDRTPPFLIGLHYFNNPATSANANIWADAFANFGNLGVLVVTLVLGSILWVYDSLMADVDRRLAVVLLGVPSLAFASSSLPVVFVTHGVGLVLLVAFLMPREIGHHADAAEHSMQRSNETSNLQSTPLGEW